MTQHAVISAETKRRAELMRNEDVRWLMARAETKGGQDVSSYLLYSMLLALETYSGGDKMRAGQIMDDALTHFLAEFKAALGDEATSAVAGSLIWNISLFLPAGPRDRIQAILGGKKR
jgi:hypothetical protein